MKSDIRLSKNAAKFLRMLNSYELNEEEKKQFVVSMPALLEQWFSGRVMCFEYEDVKETSRMLSFERMDSQKGYRHGVILMDLISKMFKLPEKQLYRAITVHKDLNPDNNALLYPGKNVLSSWTDEKGFAEYFLENISIKNEKPFAYIICAKLSKEIKANWNTVLSFLHFLSDERENLYKVLDLYYEMPLNVYNETIDGAKYMVESNKEQREYVCYIPTRKKVYVVNKYLIRDNKLIQHRSLSKVLCSTEENLNAFMLDLKKEAPRFKYKDCGYIYARKAYKSLGDCIEIDGIEAMEPNKGHGTMMMQFLTQLADKHKVMLFLVVDPYGKKYLKKEKLIEFYRKHGFKSYKTGGMLRKPL